MEKEIRNIKEIRSDIEGRLVSGYAIRFNEPSENLGFFEKIDRGAVTDEIIQKSDIFALLDHDTEKVLARSKYGVGNLKLTLDDYGLFYEFRALENELGNTLLEYIKAGIIDSSSFCFTVSDEEDAEEWYRDADGTVWRTIKKIDRLFDVSPVFSAAYSTTTCTARSLEKVEELKRSEENLDDEEQETVKEETVEPTEEQTDEKEEPMVEEPMEEEPKEEEPMVEELPKEEKEEQNEEERNNKNHNKFIKMKENFSIVRALRHLVNNQPLNEVDSAVLEAGKAEARKNGFSANGIVLPMEQRAISVTTEHDDIIDVELWDCLMPFQANSVLAKAGAKMYTNLVGDVKIPIASKENVFWEAELATAQDGAGSFSSVTLSPKRVSAVIEISKQLLAQDSIGVENIVRQLLSEALTDKIEATVLGDGSGSTTEPEGILHAVSATSVSAFSDVCDVEAKLENANIPNGVYVVNPKAKAALRGMIKGTNGTGMVYENNEVDGTPAYVTSNLANKKYIYGDFADSVALGFWGTEITYDPYTSAAKGAVRLVLNAYVDAKIVRPEALAVGELA